MHRHLLRILGTTLLLLTSPLPRSTAQTLEPEFAKAPFPVSGNVQGVSLQQIATDISPMTGITHAGDGRLFLTIRDGRIMIFENGHLRPQLFLDIRGLTT